MLPHEPGLPSPWIVGVPRSGTTLLRFMLDAHSQLAVPPETGFVPALAALAHEGDDARVRFLSTLLGFESWPDFHLDESRFVKGVEALQPFTTSAGLRTFYRQYAERFGKERFGDKTPSYGLHLAAIQDLMPEAHFVHILRDGRDVAISVRPLWFSPGPSFEDAARDWADRIRRTRSEAARCRKYLEVRYEDLVSAPEAVLRRVCDFLELGFEPGMLAYYTRVPERISEHECRGGLAPLTKRERLEQQWMTQFPPDSSRIGRFRAEMPEEAQARFREAASGMLEELGYVRAQA